MLKTERPLKVVAVLFGFAIASGFQLEFGIIARILSAESLSDMILIPLFRVFCRRGPQKRFDSAAALPGGNFPFGDDCHRLCKLLMSFLSDLEHVEHLFATPTAVPIAY